MPVFEYKALDDEGKTVTGVQDADSAREARVKLKARNIFVVEIKSIIDVEKGKETRPKFRLNIFRGKKIQDLAMVTRQLATLLNSGIPIMSALTCVIEQAEDRVLKAVFMDVRERIAGGVSLSEALSKHKDTFSELYVSMVRAGEASGNLDQVMFKVADYLLQQHRIRAKIQAALTYPVFMIFVAISVVLFLLTFVVPKIVDILQRQQKALPLPTEILLTTATLIRQTWWLLAFGILVIYLFYTELRKSKHGRLWLDRLLLGIPVLGPLIRKACISRFSVTFATLLDSGLPATDSLAVVKNVVGNRVIEEAVENARTKIVEGSDIATPIRTSKVFPPVVSYMVAVGEESGHLPELLRKVSQAYDEEVEIQSQRLTSLLEPVLILVMAGVVAFIVLSILLPILQMSKL